jgi:glycosyltransferase involved in cell wall biosynthesis
MRFAIDLTACWRPRVGMSTAALELARSLINSRGEDEYTILCSRERPAGMDLDCEAVLAPYRHELALKLSWIPRIETELDCDAILYPYWPSPPRRRRGAPPAAVFVYDLAFRVRPAEVPWQQRAYMGTLVPAAVGQAAAILVSSESTRRDLLDLYPRPGLSDRVSVVPLGVGATAAPGPLPERVEPGFILAVGTIEPRKNYPRLVAAYRELKKSRHDVPQLVVAGRVGWAYGSALDDLAREPGAIYLGHVDEPTLSALYQHAAVLACPSVYEGFGLPLLEAMARGLPAVIGAAGSLPELAGGAAVEVDPYDVNAIAAGLERALTDQPLRARLAELGPKRAAPFTWAAAADKTRAILRKIAERVPTAS